MEEAGGTTHPVRWIAWISFFVLCNHRVVSQIKLSVSA